MKRTPVSRRVLLCLCPNAVTETRARISKVGSCDLCQQSWCKCEVKTAMVVQTQLAFASSSKEFCMHESTARRVTLEWCCLSRTLPQISGYRNSWAGRCFWVTVSNNHLKTQLQLPQHLGKKFQSKIMSIFFWDSEFLLLSFKIHFYIGHHWKHCKIIGEWTGCSSACLRLWAKFGVSG